MEVVGDSIFRSYSLNKGLSTINRRVELSPSNFEVEVRTTMSSKCSDDGIGGTSGLEQEDDDGDEDFDNTELCLIHVEVANILQEKHIMNSLSILVKLGNDELLEHMKKINVARDGMNDKNIHTRS